MYFSRSRANCVLENSPIDGVMKVYEISTLAKPSNSSFKVYAGLYADDKIWRFIVTPECEGFMGIPRKKTWKTQPFYIDKPLAPIPNFFHVSAGAFVCDEKARELAAEPLEMSGEFLSIKVEGKKGKYWIYNCTNCINVVDSKKSKWTKLGPKPDDRMMERPAFYASRFGEESIFKIPEDRATLVYCAEFTGDWEDGEFKAVVEHSGLTGLKFKLVWTDED